jgi:hypothetical protein
MHDIPVDAKRHWLNEGRVITYSKVFLFLNIATLVGIFIYSKIDSVRAVIGGDFLVFWSASNMALHGHAADAYEVSKLLVALQSTVPGLGNVPLFWAYPPIYYLFVLPLAFLPYLASYGIFLAGTFAMFFAAMRRLISEPRMMLPVLAFPAVAINAVYGQNGFLTAALAGFALILLDKRPVLGGILIGFLSIKPQFMMLFVIALLVSGRWKSLAATTVTVLGLSASSYVVFGPDVFRAFLLSAAVTREALESGVLPWIIMPTVFAMLRLLGMSLGVAYAGQLMGTALAVGAVAVVWRSPRASIELRAALVMTGSFLASPYGYYYDLVWLAFPIAWMVRTGLAAGWLPWEREILLATWLLPIVMPLASVHLSLQVGPFVNLALFGIILQRALK